MFTMEKLYEYLSEVTDWAIRFAPKILLAMLVLYIGLKIEKRISKWIRAGLERSDIAVEISTFLASILDLVMKIYRHSGSSGLYRI